MTIFKNIYSASQLEEAVVETLIKWFPTYLLEVERQMGLEKNYLKIPTSYTNRNSLDFIPGEALPKVVVVSPGTLGAPVVNGFQYRAVWNLGVGVCVASADEVMANKAVKAYGAAVRGIILQNKALGGSLPIVDLKWVSETYNDLPIQDQMSLFKAAEVDFTVDMEDMLTTNAGPEKPVLGPSSYGQVQSIDIELVKEGIA